jgi:hypothetical protein
MDSNNSAFVLGQRHAFATVALLLAFLSFVNLAGLEKAIFAIALAIKALSVSPAPRLEGRRRWAQIAIVTGSAHAILVIVVIALNLDRLTRLFHALRAMSDLR